MSRRLAVFAVIAMVLSVVGMQRPAEAQILGSPKIGSLSPSQVVPGFSNQLVKVLGTGFAESTTITIDPNDGLGFTQSFVSATEIDLVVTAAANAPTTARDVTAKAGGLLGSSNTCAACLTVGPEITAVNGPFSNEGTSGQITITGRAFVNGSTVRLTKSSYGFNGAEADTIQASNVSVATDGKSITATIATSGRAPGRWKVTVQKDTSTANFGDGLTTGLQITGSAPTLSTITPAHIAVSASNVSFALVGAGFARGMTATVSGNGVTQSAPVVVDTIDPTHKATLKLTSSNAAATLRDITLRNTDNQHTLNTEVLNVGTTDPPTGGDPTISTVSPSVIGQGADHEKVVITGTNFGPGPAPTVSVSPSTGVTIDATRDSRTQITMLVSTAADAPTGQRNLTVFVGTKQITKANAFNVSSTLAVTNLTPPGRPQGYTGTIGVNGAGFPANPSISINTSKVTFGAVTRDSAAHLTVPVTVAADAPVDSSFDVTVSGVTCTGCFKIGKTPQLSSISPTSANGNGQASVSIVGAFFSNPTFTLERTGQSPIALAISSGSTTTTADGIFDLTNAAPGVWNLVVTNEDGGTATKVSAFTVVVPAPAFATNPSPDFGNIAQHTATPVVLDVIGQNFAPGMVVTIPNAAGVIVGDVVRNSPTEAHVSVTVADSAALGSRDIKVTNADGQSGTCQSCLTIVPGNQAQFFGPGFNAYDNFPGGSFIASGHLGGPTAPTEVVTGANAGGGPHVKAWIINSSNGQATELQSFFAYGAGFAGGVRVAVGDINGDGTDEIVTGAGPGGGPHVRIFHINTDRSITEPVGGFFAYDAAFSGGVWVATGDVDGDGKAEIITGAGAGGGPHVKVWKLVNGAFQPIGSFFAYAPAFQGGVPVAAGNLIPEAPEAAVIDEIITVPGQDGGPHVRVFNANGTVKSEFFAFSDSDSYGYRVAVGDFDFDNIDDFAISRGSSPGILVGHLRAAAPGFEPIVLPNPTPLLGSGANVAAGDVDSDGDDDLAVVPDHGSLSTVRLMRPLSTS